MSTVIRVPARALVAFCVAVGFLAGAQGALAAPGGPGWEINAHTVPTNLPPGGVGTVAINAFNIGAGPSHGTITVTDSLPPGVTALEAGELVNLGNGSGSTTSISHGLWDCTGNTPGNLVAGASIVTCTNDPSGLPTYAGGGGAPVQANQGKIQQPIIAIAVHAGPEAPTETNRVSIAGGGAPTPARSENPMTISATTPPFGFVGWHGWFSNADGTIDTQAGSHPYEWTLSFDLARAVTRNEAGEVEGAHVAGGEARDIEVQLPPGLIANPNAVPQCTRPQLTLSLCPRDSQVGIVTAYFAEFGVGGFRIFNMVPPEGQPAQLAFNFEGVLNVLGANVRTGSDSGISSLLRNTSQRVTVGSVVTLWGVPGEASHDIWRSGVAGGCTVEEVEVGPSTCRPSPTPTLNPFLTLPTYCGSAQPFTINALNTWQDPTAHSSATFLSSGANSVPTGFTGCENLAYEPAISLQPETSGAESPTGLSAEVNPPLGGLEEPGLLVPSNTRHVTVSLPPGISVNPGQAAGLQACQETAAASAIGTEGPASCPPASKIGTAVIRTPLLESAAEKTLQGNVYILRSNPPQIHLLVAANADGVNLKLVGIVHLDPQTGQLVSTFGADPQVEAEDPFLAGHLALPDLPFSSFQLTFNGGSHAALVTPEHCGSYSAQADFTPWASPALPDVNRSPSFAVTSGPNGSACPSTPLPFSPTMLAGTTNPVAGASSAFALKLTKPDGQQNIKTIETDLPPGQLAKLAGVPLCPAADAPSGNCPAGSEIGSVSAAVGPGPSPLAVPQPGKAPTAVYLAGPYKGAPYSLVVKVPAQAGPFDLGTVVTRVALQVNETTTQVTAVSDPLPQILDGVPLAYQSIVVSIDRPGFIRNPTNCEPMKVTGTITGSEGAKANVSNRYQIGDCASLGFKPSLKLSLKGATKRSGVPALKAVLTYPKANYANIKRASVALPHSEFLDQAHIKTICTRVQFNAGAGNGAQCPKGSIYGKATAASPLLDQPLSGPVYLRSSNNPLPDLVVALHGQIDVALVGRIDSKNGGIRTTFASVPDAPVSKFTLQMQGGKKGLLVNSTNLCRSTNRATAKFTGQNGKTYDTRPVVTNSCKKQGKKAPKGHGRR